LTVAGLTSKLPGSERMDRLGSVDALLFEGFRFDRSGGDLFRLDQSGVAAPVPIGSRALRLLSLLVERPGELVSKDAIIDAVWPRMVVEEGNLTVQISALRRILDHDREQGSCIQTVPGRGYRFIAPVTRVDSDAPSLSSDISIPEPIATPRPSIVVLPFKNLSNDTEQQYFADGITEDLTTDLSRIAHSLVISCNTAFTYRNKRIDTRQIGRELGVRYVLEGSIRRSGSRVRVTAQLIDAAADAHLWADRFDSDTVDLSSLQNEITSRIANALGVELIAAEAARLTEYPDALDLVLRGRAVLWQPRTHDSYMEAINLFEHALALDPESVEAQSRLANALVVRVLNGMAGSPAADLARAEGLIDQALATSPRYAFAHHVKGHVLLALRGWEEAIAEYEAALASNHNLVAALHGLALCKLCAGSIGEVPQLMEQAIRLSPRDPGIGHCYDLIGIVHLLQSHIEEAIVWLEKARGALPGVPVFHSHLASAYALSGEAERASAELAEARRLGRGDFVWSIARVKASGVLRMSTPKTLALAELTFLAGLRKAGMPEE
jgi:adenylate cyclase